MQIGVKNSNSTYPDIGNSITVTPDGSYIYVTGKKWNGDQGYDYITIKYSSNGSQTWVASYDGEGSGDDISNKIVIDGDENTYITGGSTGDGTDLDYVTIKYNFSGVQQWLQRYDGTASSTDIGYSLKVDDNGKVFVTGSSYGTSGEQNNLDIVTIRYNADGSQQWLARYDGASHLADEAFDIAVWTNHGIYVAGYSEGNTCTTLKYDLIGDLDWVNTTNGSGRFNSLDIFYRTIGKSPSNYTIDVFCTGITNNNYGITSKIYDNGNQDQVWPLIYNGSTSEFLSLGLDQNENVYTSGYKHPSYYSDLTESYDKDGNVRQNWPVSYDNGHDNKVSSIKVFVDDNQGGIVYEYVTGNGYDANTGHQSYLTIQYGPWQQNIIHKQDNENISNANIPKEYSLGQNFPNPFNPLTSINYGVPAAGFVKLSVYNLIGQEVAILVNDYKVPGYYDVKFDGSNLSSGVYFYKIQCNNFIVIKKMILVR